MSDQGIHLRDQLSIDTPELVNIEFPIAGIGSRFAAVLLDYVIQGVAMTVGVLLLVALAFIMPTSAPRFEPPTSDAGFKWIFALMILVPFLLQWGYFTLFEAFWNGQTPGKRLVKLRVIQQTGRPLGFFESLTRNLLRAIDMLPACYVIGGLFVFISRRQQRLGDMVAGTLVVHVAPVESSILANSGHHMITAPLYDAPQTAPANYLPADALARLNQSDLEVIESFLSRKLDLPLDVRAQFAQKLSERMAAKMHYEIPAATTSETFLEDITHGLRQIGGAL